MSVSIKKDNHIDLFTFRSYPWSAEINNPYLNELPLIKKFITYFMHQASTCIEESYSYQFSIAEEILEDNIISPLNSVKERERIELEEFLQLDRICFYKEKLLAYLPKRQSECVSLLMQGQTIKEIARNLGISERTVELQLNIVKRKLGCRTKSQLVKKVLSFPNNCETLIRNNA